MSLRGMWERRKTLLFVFASVGTCGVASAESGLNLAYAIDMIDSIVLVFPSIVDLIIAALPAIVVVSLVLFLMGVLALIEQKM